MRSICLRIACGECAPEHAADIAALQQRKIERQLRNARRETDDQIAPFPSDRTQRRLSIVTAHRIVDHIEAAATARRLELFGERLGLLLVERRAAIKDRFVGARSLGGRCFFLRRHRRDDARAIGLAQFDRREADTAGRAKHEQ